MMDLRIHPLFRPLPPSNKVQVKNAADFSLFRQDSWQWDVLHIGRLTTSRAAACLGLFERVPSKKLKISSSMSGHDRALHVWSHLQEPTPENLHSVLNSEFKSVCSDRKIIDGDKEDTLSLSHTPKTDKIASELKPIWEPCRLDRLGEGFPYAYFPWRRSNCEDQNPMYRDLGRSNPQSARMAWGSIQEATAVLAAVNYFFHIGTASIVTEIGMCPLEATDLPISFSEVDIWLKENTLPPIGASPDALVYHMNGTCEVLEVKCSSPFVYSHQHDAQLHRKDGKETNRKGDKSSLMTVSYRPFSSDIRPWHMPQLQLEILCAGTTCTSALLVTLSAFNGANIHRIKRDDEYILQMLTWIRKFYIRYVKSSSNLSEFPEIPPMDYFHNEPNYDLFLDKTLQLAASAELVTHIDQSRVQRSPVQLNFFL